MKKTEEQRDAIFKKVANMVYSPEEVAKLEAEAKAIAKSGDLSFSAELAELTEKQYENSEEM